MQNPEVVATGLKLFGAKFIKINVESVNRDLLRLVYENNSYAINCENVRSMIQEYYATYSPGNLETRGYTIVMSEKESPLAKYINANINDYVCEILKNCGEEISDDPEYALAIINNTDIDAAHRIQYISYLTISITSIEDVEDTNLWIALIKNKNALEYSAENIVAYFLGEGGIDETLIDFINMNGKAVDLHAENSDHITFCARAIRKNWSSTQTVKRGKRS